MKSPPTRSRIKPPKSSYSKKFAKEMSKKGGLRTPKLISQPRRDRISKGYKNG